MPPIDELVERFKPLKHDHYYRFYDQFLGNVREKVRSVLEIGVQSGGSLRFWEAYFPNAQIMGIDIDPGCCVHAAGRVNVLIGDQENAGWLQSAIVPRGPFDLIIDDGGHTMRQQITSLRMLWGPALARGGLYVLEDLHTSYWPDFGGGLRRPDATMELLKGLADQTNVSHQPEHWADFPGVLGVHFYDSLCFIEKKERF